MTSPVLRPEAAVAPRVEPEQAITCKRCGHAVTTARERIAKDGAHLHTRINPHGFVHELGCFASAPGARIEGPATFEATWFPGFAWRFGHCEGCGAHLGWRYEGAGETFWGLILDHLAGG